MTVDYPSVAHALDEAFPQWRRRLYGLMGLNPPVSWRVHSGSGLPAGSVYVSFDAHTWRMPGAFAAVRRAGFRVSDVFAYPSLQGRGRQRRTATVTRAKVSTRP